MTSWQLRACTVADFALQLAKSMTFLFKSWSLINCSTPPNNKRCVNLACNRERKEHYLLLIENTGCCIYLFWSIELCNQEQHCHSVLCIAWSLIHTGSFPMQGGHSYALW